MGVLLDLLALGLLVLVVLLAELVLLVVQVLLVGLDPLVVLELLVALVLLVVLVPLWVLDHLVVQGLLFQQVLLQVAVPPSVLELPSVVVLPSQQAVLLCQQGLHLEVLLFQLELLSEQGLLSVQVLPFVHLVQELLFEVELLSLLGLQLEAGLPFRLGLLLEVRLFQQELLGLQEVDLLVPLSVQGHLFELELLLEQGLLSGPGLLPYQQEVELQAGEWGLLQVQV